ncbi:MAG: hypothetical protein HKM93_17330, partial [Desulfobacteraceae bacterium]|nr:hypothetical protein [Desulfobacteraceae bacterium]
MENSLALKFYHPDRFPIVHFMTGGELCHGFLTSFRRNGVQIRVDSSVGIEPGAILTAVQIEKYGRSFSGPDLIAADIIHHPRYWEATADTQSDSDSEHLARSLTDLESPPASPAAGIDPTTIPRVHRQLHYQQEAVSARLDWAGQVSGADLKYLAKNIFKPEALAGNIENYIGAVQIPVGLVGPILINGLYCRGYVPVPVATTEGALISSMTRGSLTCNQSGGITVHVQRQTMVRAPVFFVDDMDAGIALEQWVNAHEPEIRAKAESVSAVARLTRIVPFVFENTVHIRFYYTTGDAAGQNMTTACTWMACRWIKRKVKQNRAIGPLEFIVEGNMSGDKKVTAQSIVDGRGIAVTATCRIPGHVMKKRLRVTPER